MIQEVWHIIKTDLAIMTDEIIDCASNEDEAKTLTEAYQRGLGMGWDVTYELEG